MQFFAAIKKTSSIHQLWSRMGRRMASLHGVTFFKKGGQYVSDEVTDTAQIKALKDHRAVELSVVGATAAATVNVPGVTDTPAMNEPISKGEPKLQPKTEPKKPRWSSTPPVPKTVEPSIDDFSDPWADQ